jgi:hypothetical protein
MNSAKLQAIRPIYKNQPFLHTSNEKSEKEIKKILFTTAIKKNEILTNKFNLKIAKCIVF